MKSGLWFPTIGTKPCASHQTCVAVAACARHHGLAALSAKARPWHIGSRTRRTGWPCAAGGRCIGWGRRWIAISIAVAASMTAAATAVVAATHVLKQFIQKTHDFLLWLKNEKAAPIARGICVSTFSFNRVKLCTPVYSCISITNKTRKPTKNIAESKGVSGASCASTRSSSVTR